MKFYNREKEIDRLQQIQQLRYNLLKNKAETLKKHTHELEGYDIVYLGLSMNDI